MKKLNPLRAIRCKCLECTNNQIVEVRECRITTCPIYPFRNGHLPKNSYGVEMTSNSTYKIFSPSEFSRAKIASEDDNEDE